MWMRIGAAGWVLGLGMCILPISNCAVPKLLTEPIVWLEFGGQRGPFDLDARGPDARLDPKVLQRVRASPVGYFRFVNTAFRNEVCHRFEAHLSTTPIVNLHGDAHLEQYAVTDTGRGLTDFDDAASGPVVLDLVRFSTSLVLACQEREWNDEVERALEAFFRGYRRALENPRLRVSEPPIVSRLRSNLRFNPADYFGWLESILDPVSTSTRLAIQKGLEPYVHTMLAADPALGRQYFQLQNAGRSRIGVGSARADKYLVRVRGSTGSPDDDVILELKELTDLSGVTCLSRRAARDPMRLLLAQARIAYEPYRLIGFVKLDAKDFWVHAWARSHREISALDLRSPDELGELAFDAGVQLGLGHPKDISAPFDHELRRSLLQFLDLQELEVRSLSKEMSAELTAAWSRFREATASSP
jgi:hypothetical protein